MSKEFVAAANVRCGGKKHRISLTQSGRLVFHDHEPGLKSERVAVALGAEPCRCLEVLGMWQEKIRNKVPRLRVQARTQCKKVPKELEAIIDAKRSVSMQRYQERHKSCCAMKKKAQDKTDGRNSMWHCDAPKPFFSAVKTTAEKCFFRGNAHVYKCTAHGTVIRNTNNVTGSNVRIGVWMMLPTSKKFLMSLLPSWYKSVYQRGLAIVGGVFIMKIIEETPSGIHVHAGRQEQGGFNILACNAYISLSPEGKPIGLQWLE